MDKLLISKLFDQTLHLIQKSLDLRTLRHRVLSDNVAHSEVPNYPSKDIPFEKILERSSTKTSSIYLKTTHPGHLSLGLEDEVRVEPVTEGINLDQEMAKLAENNLMFQAGVQVLIKKLEGLKFAISEGGK